MFGLENPPLDVRAMDRRLGRKPRRPIAVDGVILELLRHSLTVVSVVDTDLIDKMLGYGGYEYAKRYYDASCASRSQRLTRSAYETWKRKSKEYRQEKEYLPGKDKAISRPPSIHDIALLLREEDCPVVIVPLSYDEGPSLHLSLIYGMTGDGRFKAYIPWDDPEETLLELPPQRMQKLYATGEAIIGVSFPS